jgi:glycerol dehydrogenase
MLQIKTPEIYVSEPGAIKSLGPLVETYGKRALIVWSKTARKVTQEAVIESLGVQRINYMEYLFEGYPTLDKAEEIAELASEKGIEVLIAIGGGRVIDVTKAAGDISFLPVASVPTIAATCAAWAALSVLYTGEGNFDHFRHNKHSPRLIVADTDILVNAPIRYLRAGIVDTLAKWYETAVWNEDSFSYLNSVNSVGMAFEFLNEHAEEVIKNADEKIADVNTIKTVDAILFLAGNVGSYVGEKAYSGFAHPFYHSSRIIKETRDTLHGELVAFGLIMQAVLERKSKEEILAIVKKFSALKVAFTLEEIGLSDQAERKLQIISDRIHEVFEHLPLLEGNTDERAIINAAYEANAYVKAYRKEAENVND